MNELLSEGLGLLESLVAIPSPSGLEAEAAHHLVAWMAGHGFDATVDACGNAIGILEGPPAGAVSWREVVLLGHIDTVNGFPPVEWREGKLYGRGAVDAKGPLAAFATAAAIVGRRGGWRIVVAGAVEEESASSKGARWIARQRRPDQVIIGEPTKWQRIALGYKGRLLAEVTMTRPMAHRAGPENTAAEVAVAAWNTVCERVETLNAGRNRVWDRVQANLRSICTTDDGLFEVAQMALGYRLPCDISPDHLKSVLEGFADGASVEYRGEEIAYRADKNTRVVRALLSAVRSAGGTPSFVLKTGTSDMNVVGPIWRCPIAVYGPGDSSLDHTPQEHISAEEWHKGVEVLADALQRLTDTPQSM